MSEKKFTILNEEGEVVEENLTLDEVEYKMSKKEFEDCQTLLQDESEILKKLL